MRSVFLKKKRMMKAFSVPEVLLSMFVLSIGLVTIVAVMAGSLRHSYDTSELIVATGLAQEGVELVRNARDSGFTLGVGKGFTYFSDTNKYCRAQYNSSQTANIDCVASPDPASRYYLQYRGAIYYHYNTTKQRYSRFIYIDYDSTNKTALVRSFVYWDGDGDDIRHANGDPAACNVSSKCVYTEIFLTSWK